MICEYLNKELGELIERKNKLQEEQEILKTHLKETLKFINILSENLDERYESFSPYEINSENHRKREKLTIEHKEYEVRIRDNCKEIQWYENKVYALKVIISRVEILEMESDYRFKQSQNEKVGLGDFDNEIFRLKLLETQEAERQRIARDLHDSTVQNLTAMTHKLEFCSRVMDTDPIRSKLELLNTSKNMRENINDMRKIIYDLRPMPLDDMGMEVAIERELGRLENESGVQIKFIVEGESRKNLPVVSLTLFRIVQEACYNAIKHADPSHIKVVFKNAAENVEVHIIDDGKGFDTEKKVYHEDVRKGLGLATMKERIYLLSGTLDITSKVGKGTDIYVTVPVRAEDEEYAD